MKECKHVHIQEYTETCLDCGKNLYEEYLPKVYDSIIERERKSFEFLYPIPKHCIWNGASYSITEYNAWETNNYQYLWLGWLAKAQQK